MQAQVLLWDFLHKSQNKSMLQSQWEPKTDRQMKIMWSELWFGKSALAKVLGMTEGEGSWIQETGQEDGSFPLHSSVSI